MGKEYRLRLLGPVQVERAGESVRGFESHKALALLGYLAAHDRPLTRSYLANLFWQDKPEARGRGNLNRVLHNLSSLLPACLNINRDTVQFQCADAYWLDTRAFDELCARGEAAALTAAVALYRDEFMAGIFLDDCPDFETWLVVERERWQQRVSQVLQTLIAYHTQRGECEPGLRLASRWLDLDPWREEAHRQKMLLLALSGQRSDALAQYETCRRLLANELSAEPTKETTTLYAQIRDGMIAPLPPPRVSPPHNLPASLTPFVGRAAELAKIAERLANPDCRLITLVGPGGIGKTRLALHAALANVHAFADGAFLVPLAPVPSADLIVSAIALALKLSLRGATDPQARLLDYLRTKKMLLILDSFEHLLSPVSVGDAGGATLLVEILRNAPQLKILVTSRERLNLQAEWRLEVEGLPYPDFRFQISDFRLRDAGGGTENLQSAICNRKFPAVELFVQSARRAHADFSLEHEWTGTLRICCLTRGLPLAIELAAASARDFSCDAIATEIERNLNFLATTMQDVPERHRSARAAFDHSWNLLREEERRAFSRLAVFRGGFDADAAKAVNGELNTIRHLAPLVDKSLLRQDTSGRYEMHELVRQYAEAKLEGTGEAVMVRGQHLEYFMTLAERADAEIQRPKQDAWFERLENEHDNVRAALAWSLKIAKNETGLRLASALFDFWLARGYLNEGRRWLEQLLANSNAASDARCAKALSAAAGLALAQGSYDYAATLYHQALALFEQQEDKASTARVLSDLGLIATHKGDYERAARLHGESLALKQELGNKNDIARSYLNLGNVAWFQGDYARAAQLYEASLAIRRELGDKRGIAFSSGNVAMVYMIQRDYARAREFYETNLAVFQELKDKQNIAHTLGNLGLVARRQQEYERAAKLYAEGMTLSADIEDRRNIAICCEGLAGVACACGAMERAARLFGAAEAIYAALGERKPPFDRENYECDLAAMRAALGENGLATQWAEGRAMSLEQAMQYALQKP